MWKRLEAIEERFRDLERLMADPEVLKSGARYRDLAKELALLRPLVEVFQELKRVEEALKEATAFLDSKSADSELHSLYDEERKTLAEKKTSLKLKIEDMLLAGEEEHKAKDVIVEIRAGTGGEEAALFAGDLFRMYTKYCARCGLKVDVLSTSQTGLGGFKEIVFSVSGANAYRLLKWESGTHRVQRVPVTEASGRIHTSAVTVAVLPEPEEVEVELDPKDLRVDVFRSSGPGGQSVNTTDSAVRITHLPSGLVVQCQDEKSQHKNKAKALRILRARVLDKKEQEQREARSRERRSQVGSGDRSEKIRTYNFPDRRATDHRIGLTVYAVDEVMEGHIEPFVTALEKEQRARILAREKSVES